MLDWTGQIAVEAFTCMLVFKNMFSFVLTFYAYDWVIAAGFKTPFIYMASIQVGVCLLAIPMCKQTPLFLVVSINQPFFGARS
jgi:hypothetical protein